MWHALACLALLPSFEEANEGEAPVLLRVVIPGQIDITNLATPHRFSKQPLLEVREGLLFFSVLTI